MKALTGKFWVKLSLYFCSVVMEESVLKGFPERHHNDADCRDLSLSAGSS